MANKKKAVKKEPETITTKKIVKEVKFDNKGLREITLLKDHGHDKKGDKLFRHPNTAQNLIDSKIAE